MRKLLGVVLLCWLGCGYGVGAAAQVSAQVSTEGKKMILTATYEVPVPEAEVFAVISDFDAMPRYTPGLAESHILSRQGNVLQVRQRGTIRWGLISSGYDSIREMTMLAHGLHGHSLDAENGVLDSDTTLSTAEGKTLVSYHAVWWPASSIVRLFGEAAVRANLVRQMSAQYEEILRVGHVE
jgi:ribosome-associated toxin RatA of RatAB toxin-antitoxin module